jgi:hypothetical protein
MSQDPIDEIPQEVDFTHGVRGKYLARYRVAALKIQSPLVWTSTASTVQVGEITKAATYPPAYPSPNLQLGPVAR